MRPNSIFIIAIGIILAVALAAAGCTQESTGSTPADTGSAAVSPAIVQQTTTASPVHATVTMAADPGNRTAPSGTPPAGMQMNGTRPSGTPPAGMEMNGTPPSGTPPSGTPPGGSGPGGSPPSWTSPSGTAP